MRTSKEISAEMDGLKVSSSSPPTVPVTMGGWYECEDGSYRQIEWTPGARGGPKTRVHVRDRAAAARWDELDAEGQAAADREHYAKVDASGPKAG